MSLDVDLLRPMTAPDSADAYGRIHHALADGTESPQALHAAFDDWDRTRREWKTYAASVRLRYVQDTRDEERRAAQRGLDEQAPAVNTSDKAVKQRILASPSRASLEESLGPQAFALWSADVAAHDNAIAADLVRESELTREYVELLAGASTELDGVPASLTELSPSLQSHDRETRHRAERARWSIFSVNGPALDRIYDDLVTVRDRMARMRGFPSFVELGYERMHRVDYDAADVTRFRDDVVRLVVPLASNLVRRYGAQCGYDRVRLWDENALVPGGAIVPKIERARFMSTGVEALAAMDPALGDFGTFMHDGGLYDIDARPGKAFGAFCTSFPTRGKPYVFANFSGSRDDVRTLMHELGHAFQSYRSRDLPAVDYLTPTYESAEIHSMSLEYLSWPEMSRFFGDSAERYRREHLLHAMLFIPYGVAVDHFQHLVYAHPAATPAERHAMWREMEARYLPWRDYGDLAYPRLGGLWQEKRHIYAYPFYYIDYTLALTCALQFWQRADRNRDEALSSYVALCGRGGEAPFRELVRSAGLTSPFAGGLEAPVAAIANVFAS